MNSAPTLFVAKPGLAAACHRASAWSRDELIALAVARGCRHYAGFASAGLPARQPELPHEVLGCALLGGPADADTFRAIRVGAMVLSDRGNSPERMAAAAHFFGVESRLLHIARLGLKVDGEKDFWAELLARLPATDDSEADPFLPGASRFSVESPRFGPNGVGNRIWLRTNHRR